MWGKYPNWKWSSVCIIWPFGNHCHSVFFTVTHAKFVLIKFPNCCVKPVLWIYQCPNFQKISNLSNGLQSYIIQKTKYIQFKSSDWIIFSLILTKWKTEHLRKLTIFAHSSVKLIRIMNQSNMATKLRFTILPHHLLLIIHTYITEHQRYRTFKCLC